MAARYATALFELALEQHAIDAVRADLDRFDALLSESADLLRLVRSPVFTADEQLKSLSAILDQAGIKGLAADFLKVVTANRRLFAVRDLIRGYRQLVAPVSQKVAPATRLFFPGAALTRASRQFAARHKGEVTAEVTLAEKPNDAHLAAIKDALRAVTKKDVQVDVKIDPSIIGGLIVK